MKTYKLTGLILRDSNSMGYKAELNVTVEIDAKTWHKAKKVGNLGMIYNVDIGNDLFRDYNYPAYFPMVSDKRRAKNGIKTVELTFFTNNLRDVEKLGLECRCYGNELEVKYGQRIDLLANVLPFQKKVG